jgi:hypothetical protein
VADHLIPNQVLGFFEFFRERERGEVFCFKGLQKAIIGADSRNLKMRRLPPAAPPYPQVSFSSAICQCYY